MFHKIQPQQIDLHAFSSPSGDMRFEAGSDYVYANLSRSLTGNFNVVGSISVDGSKIFVGEQAGDAIGTESFIHGGTDNFVSGDYNGILSSLETQILGTGNVAINARSSSFNAASKDNTILCGRSVNFLSGVTGSCVIKDQLATNLDVSSNNSLVISFESGVYFDNGNIQINQGNLYVDSSYSGLFSGDLHALGTIYENGVQVATTGDLLSVSGILDAKIASTGLYSVTASGNLNSRLNTAVFNTGTQTISGDKTFNKSPILSQTLFIQGNSGIQSGVSAGTLIVPTSSGDSAGSRGMVAYSGQFLYLKISDAPHIWARHSGSINW